MTEELNTSDELLPCPFCGGEPWISDMGGWETGCTECGANGPFIFSGGETSSRQDAAKAWNNRTGVGCHG